MAEPSEREINEAASHLDALKAIAELPEPTEAEIEAAEKHLATLKAIEDAA